MSTERGTIITVPAPGELFTVTVEHTHTFRAGWGVSVTAIHAGEDEPDPDAIVALDATVVAIIPAAVRVIGHVPCVPIGDADTTYAWEPVENFRTESDDWSDSRWFATVEEATQHMRAVERFCEAHGLTA